MASPFSCLKYLRAASWIRRLRLMVITLLEPVATEAVPMEYWWVVWLWPSSPSSRSFRELRRRQQLDRLSGLLDR